jgi:DNA polymerase III subunit epsilon
MSVVPLNVVPVMNPPAPPHPAGQPCPALDDLEFVVMDLETTGWSPEQDAITEVGAVRVRSGLVLDELASLVNPGASVPEEITALTGLTDAMLALAPPIEAVLPILLTFAAGCVIAAHNAPFDIGFVSAASGAIGVTWPAAPVLDTLTLARALVDDDEVPDHKLTTLTRYFGIAHQPSHRALADARATADLLTILLGRARGRGLHTLCELLAWLDAIQAATAVG